MIASECGTQKLLRIVVMQDVTWFKCMHFQPDNITGEAMQDIIDDMDDVHANNVTSDMSVTPPQSGGSIP